MFAVAATTAGHHAEDPDEHQETPKPTHENPQRNQAGYINMMQILGIARKRVTRSLRLKELTY
jgi:hypothetical protein